MTTERFGGCPTVGSTIQNTTVDVSDDIYGLTEPVVEFICKIKEATVLKTTVKSFHNQKPGITRTIQASLLSTQLWWA